MNAGEGWCPPQRREQLEPRAAPRRRTRSPPANELRLAGSLSLMNAGEGWCPPQRREQLEPRAAPRRRTRSPPATGATRSAAKADKIPARERATAGKPDLAHECRRRLSTGAASSASAWRRWTAPTPANELRLASHSRMAEANGALSERRESKSNLPKKPAIQSFSPKHFKPSGVIGRKGRNRLSDRRLTGEPKTRS
jgi:hypothetical protein